MAGVALASRLGHDENGYRCRKSPERDECLSRCFHGRASLASRKRLASLSGCERVGLESASALTGHASCLTTQRATAVTAAKYLHPLRGTNHVEKKLDRLRDDGLTPRRICGGTVARYVAGRRLRTVDALRQQMESGHGLWKFHRLRRTCWCVLRAELER